MTRNYVFGFILVWIALFLSPATLRANPAPMPIFGGTVSAKSPHETIRIEAEDVTIRLGGHTYTVEGVYHMVNSGEATTEWVGFPKTSENMHDLTYQNFLQFHAWADGKKISLAEEGKQWLAGQVNFPGQATTILRVMYEAKYPETYKWMASAGDFAEYIVGTGSLWKGNNGKAVFTVDGSALDGTQKFDAELKVPQCRKLRSGQVIRFDAKAFKPERDAILLINIGGGRRGDALPAGENSESE
jgi:hypothetical protein